MPKLKNIEVHARGTQNFDITFNRTYPCKVLADGVFYAEIDENQITEFEATLPRCEQGTTVDLHRNKHAWLDHGKDGRRYVAGKTLDIVQAALQKHARWKVEVTRDEQLVIFYWESSDARYFVSANGQVSPNGVDAGPGGEWHGTGNTHMFSRKGFGSNIAAIIVKRVVSTGRDGAKSIDYERVYTDKNDLGPEGTRLNTFGDQPWPSRPSHREKEGQFIPYTEKAAKFFADMLQDACEEADRRRRFFADPDKIARDIENGVKI